MATFTHINTIRTESGVRMLLVDGNGVRKAYQVSPEIEDSAYTELHTSPARPATITVEIENDQIVNYYR